MGRDWGRETVNREVEGVTSDEFDPALGGIDCEVGSGG